MEALGSSEISVLSRATGVVSQKTAFFRNRKGCQRPTANILAIEGCGPYTRRAEVHVTSLAANELHVFVVPVFKRHGTSLRRHSSSRNGCCVVGGEVKNNKIATHLADFGNTRLENMDYSSISYSHFHVATLHGDRINKHNSPPLASVTGIPSYI
jgi:hypothetical protein